MVLVFITARTILIWLAISSSKIIFWCSYNNYLWLINFRLMTNFALCFQQTRTGDRMWHTMMKKPWPEGIMMIVLWQNIGQWGHQWWGKCWLHIVLLKEEEVQVALFANSLWWDFDEVGLAIRLSTWREIELEAVGDTSLEEDEAGEQALFSGGTLMCLKTFCHMVA